MHLKLHPCISGICGLSMLYQVIASEFSFSVNAVQAQLLQRIEYED